MKQIRFLLQAAALLLTAGAAQAQVSYNVQPIPYSPYPYNGGAQFSVPDDMFSTVLPIGFSFNFFGVNYSQVVLSSNGYITFDTTQQSAYSPWPINAPVPDTANVPVKNAIMVAWTDLYNPAGGGLYYATYGTAPNRTFVLSYDSVAMFSCTTLSATLQIVLHETSNAIDLFIDHKDTCSWNGGYAIEGIVDSSGAYGFNVPGRNYPTVWTANNDGYRFCTGVAPSSLTDTITGRVYADLNHNCIFDGSDYGLSQQLVMASDCNMAYTDANGFYSIPVDAGAYGVTHAINGYMQGECPAANLNSVTISGTYTVQSGVDFADTLTGACTDVYLTVGTWTMASCGHNQYTAYYCNDGAMATTAMQLDVTLPDSIYITASDAAPTAVAGNVYTFSLPSLSAGACTAFHFTDSVDCNVALGSYKCLTAVISGTPDCDASNNNALDCHTVAASYDPNEMFVAKDAQHYLHGEIINNSDSLTYQINFQNTGTAPAVNVSVTDTLPASLDWTTVQTTISSHNYTVTNNNGILTWSFSNINLPDSGANELASHGFVRFKVKQATGNAPGSVIPNKAAIYFDVNAPVVTNTAADTLFQSPTGLAALSAGELRVFPNPATSTVNVSFTGNTAGATLSVYNQLGALVQTLALPRNGATLDVHSWAKGVYLLRLSAGGQSSTRTLTVQ